jgi:hypothetical protein
MSSCLPLGKADVVGNLVNFNLKIMLSVGNL